ncbi:glycosyltransferase family 2 protein [Methyloprofundus sp.]|uniref:glycosyltransferase family 2 protein n=1 Tax=Methyloprofundus sp. TaxID=2020875 RepID=UPI003D0C6533
MKITIVLPAKNEAQNITAVLQSIQSLELDAEVLVINDGSTDNTAELAELAGATVISHPYSQGNGAAIKTGARNASGEITIFMDGDGQHNPVDIPMFLEKMAEGYDMVVGARNVKSQASLLRRFGNAFYNRFATLMTGHKIDDLTSGFRAVKTNKFKKFLYLMPNGFSYPTTSTMAFFRSGFPVAYVPIHAGQRKGKSHIRLFRDGTRFFIIILRIGSLFSPMRLFLPVSISLFLLGIGYYAYTFITLHRFTNMSALLLNTSVITFLMGFLSEQVSALHYRHAEDD